MLADGSAFATRVFLAQAHRAASARDDGRLREIAELAAAFVPSRERQLETTTQGRAFIEIARAAWTCDGLDQLIAACGGAIVYPVAVGLVSAAHAIPLGAGAARLPACAGVELDFRRRAGWSRSARPTASAFWPRSKPMWSSTAKRALEASLDDLGSATFRADLASLRHETQYTRLFRS